LLDDDNKRREIGMAGRKYVETNHNWMNIAAQLESVYEAVIDTAKTSVKFKKQGNDYGNR